MPMNHTMYESKIADRPQEEWPKIVDEVAKLWRTRLTIDCKRYDLNIADRLKDMNRKLERAENELKAHKEEIERKKLEENEKKRRLQKKKSKEKHWEMIRWLTAFIDNNKEDWDEMKRKRLQEDENPEKLQVK